MVEGSEAANGHRAAPLTRRAGVGSRIGGVAAC